VTLTTPANGGEYLLRSSLLANYSCSDPTPGSGMSSCTGTVATSAAVDTGTVGTKSFTVTARDLAGNETVRTHSYAIVYAITIAPLKTPANLGSAVPIEWALYDALGVSIQSLSTLVKMESVFNGSTVPTGGCVSSGAGPRVTLYSPATGATGGSSFRLSAGGYKFNWDSTTAVPTGKGCYTLVITLNDGSAPKLTKAVQLK
jgi:hypothetical protein